MRLARFLGTVLFVVVATTLAACSSCGGCKSSCGGCGSYGGGYSYPTTYSSPGYRSGCAGCGAPRATGYYAQPSPGYAQPAPGYTQPAPAPTGTGKCG